ncbi:septin 4b isoform X2 [Antennarius striatus]|uniref:septin 4b isoform X2 n=1 Tax=Antennarius striatus TaxID=241820 RepID=UPI0035AFFD79
MPEPLISLSYCLLEGGLKSSSCRHESTRDYTLIEAPQIAEFTVAPVAMEDSDHEVHSSEEQDSCPALPNHSRDHDVEQQSSQSDDSEVENIMHDHDHQGGHIHHHDQEPPDTGREAKCEECPNSPLYLRPPLVGGVQSDSGSDLSLPASRSVEFDLSCPISPTRPKSPWGRFDPYNTNEDQDKEYVGFATLPNQVHRKSVKKGFDFTLMVAGESGLGKSTLVNSLFLTDLYKDRKLLNAEERITQTVEITKHTVDIEEKGVKLKLTIVDTPGFGDAVNNTECWKSVADYIDQQFEQYFRDESGLNRKNIQDNRVHCCLYFISPFGHGLRPLDVEFMRALHEKVNIVPVLAKADTLTPNEVKKKKIKIREEIEQYGIKIYQFPDCDSDEDEEFKQQDTQLKESIPFAVIGSNTVVEAKGKRVRGRLYPWGIVEVENSAHCDFVKLRNMLVRTHMQDLKDVTRETHYENYRAHCIQSMTRMVVKERNRNKLTRESGTDFPIPAVPEVTMTRQQDNETEKLIREKDEELRRMQEMLQRIKVQMHTQRDAY